MNYKITNSKWSKFNLYLLSEDCTTYQIEISRYIKYTSIYLYLVYKIEYEEVNDIDDDDCYRSTVDIKNIYIDDYPTNRSYIKAIIDSVNSMTRSLRNGHHIKFGPSFKLIIDGFLGYIENAIRTKPDAIIDIDKGSNTDESILDIDDTESIIISKTKIPIGFRAD